MRSSLCGATALFTRRVQSITRLHCRKLSAQAQFDTEPSRARTESIRTSHDHPLARHRPDPHALVAPEIAHIRKCLLGLLGTAHPGLADAAEYYFLQPSKQLRSILVLLFARATNGCGSNWDQKDWEATCETRTGRSEELDRPLSQSDVLNEWNPSMPDHTASFESVFMLQKCVPFLSYPPRRPLSILPQDLPQRVPCKSSILPTQIRLAQIIEMVHIASLLHDGITTTKQDILSQCGSQIHGFGDKIAILGGDFLLGRASWALSRLGEREVVELIASVISNQVEGAFLGMEAIITPQLELPSGPASIRDAWDIYLKKTYLKTASLLAKGARSAVILGGCRQDNVLRDAAYLFGRNLGMGLQILEDAQQMRQLQHGLAIGPVLFASEECPELVPLIQRNFSNPGDIDLAVQYTQTTSGVERTLLLAATYAKKARDVLDLMPDSESKLALDALIDTVIERT